MATEVIAVLRQRNQLTLPDRIVAAVGARPGDQFAVSVAEPGGSLVTLRALPRSYAGVAGDLYGRDAEARAAYIAEERASWDGPDPGRASDGTRYLTYEESRRTYRQTEVTRERYEREPKLRWPKCGICHRSIARMNEHRAMHEAGTIGPDGNRTDPAQKARSRRRIEKWRATRARRAPRQRR